MENRPREAQKLLDEAASRACHTVTIVVGSVLGLSYCKWGTIGSRSRSGTYTHGSSYDLHTGSNRVPSSASWAPVHPVEEHVGISPFFVTSWLPVEKFGGLG